MQEFLRPEMKSRSVFQIYASIRDWIAVRPVHHDRVEASRRV
jgi:hypothetical protein